MTYPPINCRPETHNSEISSKISYLLTNLTAIGFVLTTQQENIDFCSQLKGFG